MRAYGSGRLISGYALKTLRAIDLCGAKGCAVWCGAKMVGMWSLLEEMEWSRSLPDRVYRSSRSRIGVLYCLYTVSRLDADDEDSPDVSLQLKTETRLIQYSNLLSEAAECYTRQNVRSSWWLVHDVFRRPIIL